MKKYYLKNKGYIIAFPIVLILLVNLVSVVSLGAIIGDNLPYLNILLLMTGLSFIILDYHKTKKMWELMYIKTNQDPKDKYISEIELFESLVESYEDAFEEKILDYEDRMNDLDEYLVQWTHEIKLPVSVLHLISEQEGVSLKNKLSFEIERINYYILQLLSISRERSYQKDLLLESVDIKSLVYENIKSQRTFLRDKRIEVKVEVKDWQQDSGPYGIVDKKWMDYIISQLLHNSYKYSQVDGCITISIQSLEEDAIEIKVHDDGIGIKQTEITRVFNKGFIGSNGRDQSKSTGMGLYMVKKICDLINMDVSITSVYGEGTTVTLRTKEGIEHLMLQKRHLNR